MNPRVRRILVSAAVVIGVFLLAGATYQGVATAVERREFPAPGHMIDVGGHQLHIHCTGDGAPVVILEAPGMSPSAAWGWVQLTVTRVTRVCSYDRAGLGWSEANVEPFDPSRVPVELHALLMGAKVRGPYVLAGQALGAAFVRLYAKRYPGDVAGLVLVEPGRAGEAAPRADPRFLTLSPWLARAGVLRATRMLSRAAVGLPQRSAGAVSSFLNRPDHLTRAARELVRSDDAVRLAADGPVPNGRPMVVLDSVTRDRLSILADESAAKQVSDAILRVVATVRKN
ncbi:MAG TPA: alpha/beta hydrolase [Vicinamibacterales bacterium]|nr:alpha/beta hydrolase [Vicinamibacterales bacterium]